MKNTKIYWEKGYTRADGKRYNQLILETKNTMCILFEYKCK